ncbi:Hypothetical protein P9211_05901 [Prochlorococcus marinus str. MIT 9211]|uniref:Uncharacterized protein n=1 Tax=Prochlorococcus marinus (strain MIT 9211) TaxID=93059 RepID=A9BEL1_PROM4|nr:Hypothetical protein P9211_05901 [Prochlorococcus marinus str. MIT 9211]
MIIGGSFLFLIGALSSIYGILLPYKIFQELWFPLFIPAISLFFTAVLVEALFNQINARKG